MSDDSYPFIWFHADYAEKQIIIDLVSKFASSRNLRGKIVFTFPFVNIFCSIRPFAKSACPKNFPRYMFIYYHADYAEEQIIKELCL